MIPSVRNFMALTVAPLAGALLVSACGNAPAISQASRATPPAHAADTPAPASSNALVVSGVGVGGAPSDGTYSGNPSGGALITNPSKVDAAGAITAQFTFYGPDGKVVGTSSDFVELLRAGQTTSVHASPMGSVSSGQIARVDVQAAARLWQKDPHPMSVILGQGVTVSPEAYTDHTFNVNGQLVSHYTSNLTNVAAEFYCTDSGGRFLAASGTIVQLLPGGGTAGASQMIFASEQPATCKLFAQPSLASAGS